MGCIATWKGVENPVPRVAVSREILEVRTTILPFAAGLLAASTALAQESYREELYEKGSLTLNNVEAKVREILLDNDVPPECLGNLNFDDVAQINSVIESDDNPAGKRQQVKAILDGKC